MVPPRGRVRSVLSWDSASWPGMGVQPASKSKSGSFPLLPCQVPQDLPSLWIGHGPPLHSLAVSFFSQFLCAGLLLRFWELGESCEQEAKHPAPSLSGLDGK